MPASPDLGQLVYGLSLLSLEWHPFDRDAVLVIGGKRPALRVALRGLHLINFRQSLVAPAAESLGPDCDILSAEVYRESEFLTAFLERRFSFSSHIYRYDDERRTSDDAQFERPRHVVVVTSAGNLDAVCQRIEISHR